MSQASNNPIAHAADSVAIALHGWPASITTIILAAGAILLALLAHAVLFRLIPRRVRDRHATFGALLERGRPLVLAFFIILMLTMVVPQAPIGAAVRSGLLHAFSAMLIVLIGCAVLLAIDIYTARQLARRPDDIQSDAMARKHVTQWQVLRRASHVLTIMITTAAALMAFPAVRDYGVSLLASAGAAGIVVGLAARPVLSNLIAGIQIAITQPLRVEDAVVINGQWGWVEEITSTYVVVRIWNWQRLVVPLAWLLEQPFQNWTRDSSELIGEVHWHVDYTAPIDAMREKLGEIVKASSLWSGKVVVLQVTEASTHTLQLRALVSARNSGEAWDLRCFVREQMIAFLKAEHPHALPRQRIDLEDVPPAGDQMV